MFKRFYIILLFNTVEGLSPLSIIQSFTETQLKKINDKKCDMLSFAGWSNIGNFDNPS